MGKEGRTELLEKISAGRLPSSSSIADPLGQKQKEHLASFFPPLALNSRCALEIWSMGMALLSWSSLAFLVG